MTFYTTSSLTSFPADTKNKINQSFLKDRLTLNYRNTELIISNIYDLAETLTHAIGSKNHINGVHTDIAGLIIPLGSDDIKTISNISMNIDGSFGIEAKRIFKNFDSHRMNFSTDEDFERARDIKLEELFHETFRIPTFEAYKYLPGHRFNNAPIDKEINYEKTIILVQAMYGLWLNNIYKKKI
jgi:hypothetical protein